MYFVRIFLAKNTVLIVPEGVLRHHGWPSTQAEVKTEAEAHLAGVALAEFISLFHQITRACI